MLVLTRECGEVICIGNDVRVEVKGIKKSQVRLGIDAPRGIVVDRKEVADRKQAELISQMHSSKSDVGEE